MTAVERIAAAPIELDELFFGERGWHDWIYIKAIGPGGCLIMLTALGNE
jgi:hypothetical protein